jgi:anti-sigma B factor antagonist
VPAPAYDVQRSSNSTTLVVRGSLDINTAPQLGEEIDRIVGEKPSLVVVDLSGLDLIDSSGVAALVKLYKGVKGLGGNVTISGARDQPLAIFKLLRMDKVFDL